MSIKATTYAHECEPRPEYQKVMWLDGEWDIIETVLYRLQVHGIKFCPFCGVELPVNPDE